MAKRKKIGRLQVSKRTLYSGFKQQAFNRFSIRQKVSYNEIRPREFRSDSENEFNRSVRSKILGAYRVLRNRNRFGKFQGYNINFRVTERSKKKKKGRRSQTSRHIGVARFEVRNENDLQMFLNEHVIPSFQDAYLVTASGNLVGVQSIGITEVEVYVSNPISKGRSKAKKRQRVKASAKASRKRAKTKKVHRPRSRNKKVGRVRRRRSV